VNPRGLPRWLGIAAFLLTAPSPLVAQDEWPRDTTFEGPMRFCSSFFAIDVPSGERVTVRDPGLDFLVTYFETEGHWLGVYEGNHPQTDDREIKRVRLIPQVRMDRVTDRDDKTTYLIHATQGDLPVYLHIFSDQFTGVGEDRLILQRVMVGGLEQTGCPKPTYERALTAE
jgi:hypothetical protein